MSPRNEFQARDHQEEVPSEEEEDLSQEVEPVEADPHLWPEAALADLRKGPSLTTTEAHIAERRSKRQPD